MADVVLVYGEGLVVGIVAVNKSVATVVNVHFDDCLGTTADVSRVQYCRGNEADLHEIWTLPLRDWRPDVRGLNWS